MLYLNKCHLNCWRAVDIVHGFSNILNDEMDAPAFRLCEMSVSETALKENGMAVAKEPFFKKGQK